MKLAGSCHCQAVRFTLESHTPYPYMHCYCSICRKTAGGGGYAICIMGDAATLKVRGRAHVKIYRARMVEKGKEKLSSLRRHFCGECGSALWAADPRWAENVYPFASAIDTPLPVPPERAHIMLNYQAPWVSVPSGSSDKHFAEYPDEAIIDWHKRLGLNE